MKSQMDANALLLKKYEDNKEIDIDAMGEELFGSSPDKKAAFDEKMENYDMQCDKIKIENESTVKKTREADYRDRQRNRNLYPNDRLQSG